ncbi:TetR/AcrR family transcriptional regulator [Phenylobacterium sp. LjRoot219]|uniref:TetR/AcrR family transcriptional regulator n=1 Tax=Phenylobacterium sp. LjRoot219 TaxID=3342283 RepID=UPI003ECF0120
MARQARTRTREDQEARRGQILDEAIRIVGERGFFGFTVQDLAQRCGVSNAGLLYHFSTKDELLHCMLQEFEARETAAMEPLAALASRELGRTKAGATALRRAASSPQRSRPHA